MTQIKIPVTLQIGKQGLTTSLFDEIRKQIKTRKIIKVKILRSALGEMDKKEFIKTLIKKTDTKLLHSVGFVVILEKK